MHIILARVQCQQKKHLPNVWRAYQNNCHKSTYASKIDENWSIESNLFFSQGWNVKTTHKSSDHSTCNVVYCHACELCKSFLLLRRTFASYGQLISIFSANDFSISNYDSFNHFSSIFWRIDDFRHVLMFSVERMTNVAFELYPNFLSP